VELYLDTGDLRELEDALALGVISGVTTNPTLLAAGGSLDYREAIRRFCSLVPGPVSAEVIAMDYREMVGSDADAQTPPDGRGLGALYCRLAKGDG
jgi:transaldolase